MTDSMRILITGITSIHGWPIYQLLSQTLDQDRLLGIRPPKTQIPDSPGVVPLCVTDRIRLEQIRNKFRPTHVIHAAGVCDLDVCEERPQWAYRLNAAGPEIIAEVFGQECHITHLSTDLVFSGENPPAGGYREEHRPDPVSIAGKTFAAGEVFVARSPRHCIVRLGLPIGASITGDKGAIDWIDSRFRRGLPVTLFRDEWRSSIRCEDLARKIVALLVAGATGIYHCGGPSPVSLHTIGRYVITRGGYSPSLLKGILRREEVNGPPRMGNVSLNSSKLAAFLRRLR